jgi:hypothetical protein
MMRMPPEMKPAACDDKEDLQRARTSDVADFLGEHRIPESRIETLQKLIADAVPAGPAMAPRLIAAFGTQRDRYATAAAIPASPLGRAVAEQEKTRIQLPGQSPHAEYGFLTPQASFRLIHAVRKPLGPLRISMATAIRLIQTKTASLNLAIALHRPSTVELRVHGQWSDQVDIAGYASFDSVDGAANLNPFAVPVDDSTPAALTATLSHVFADTKYHRVNYTLTGISRYVQYYEPNVSSALGNISIESAPYPVDILNTQPPASPSVLYALPTFGWGKREKHHKEVHRTMTGRGVRIYLDRGWFSSGNGELLGWSSRAGDLTSCRAKCAAS